MNYNRKISRFVLIIGFLLALGLSSCASEPSPYPKAWIDVPVDGLVVPEGEPVNIEGHAASTGGVSQVEIWANGELQFTIESPPIKNGLARFSESWTPPGPGKHTIQVVAFSMDGEASQPDYARVIVGGDTVTVTKVPPPPVVTYTPTPVVTHTPTTIPGAINQLWAEPAEIQAGACTTIRWHTENVLKVIFGGIEQDFDGSYQECLCKNQRYTLTITHLDNREEKQTVDIAVTGSCVTPTVPTPTPTSLPPDTTPPPAPSPVVPTNGLSINCKASQNLTWLPVSDESGIAQYQVQVQRHSGDNNWSEVSGSVFTGIGGKTMNLNVECGWYYRWRVRAVDGSSNIGDWSNWSLFAILLG
ncbi:MAG: Ig-like domain-containing protein [Anaerolineales bacterium]|nr:Ig-like domain-containing protein [Anaerolineales bacterium]